MSFTTHAAERAAERYGPTPTVADWSKAVLDIIDSCAGDAITAIRLAAMPHGNERWLVRLCGTAIVAVYSPAQALIITVTPSKMETTRRDAGRIGQGLAHRQKRGRDRHERPVEEDWGC